MTSVVLVHHDDYADWVFDSHHPTQGRRFTKARELVLELHAEQSEKLASGAMLRESPGAIQSLSVWDP